MPIHQTVIRDFRQFRDLTLDFSDPKTGKPLEKICLKTELGIDAITLLPKQHVRAPF
jgi:hypothetical protein